MTLTGYHYSIPFSAPLQNSATTYRYRKGLILQLTTDGHKFFAETAPLPGFTSYTLDDVITQIQNLSPKLQNIFSSQEPTDKLQQLYSKEKIYPTNQFALDTLAYQQESHKSGFSICDYLFDKPHTKLPVNAVISLISSDTENEIEHLLAQGFNTIKVKIGADFKQEYSRLKDIRSHFPELKIRADANRAWGLDEAIHNCQQLQKLNIEYCEEPLMNPSLDNYLRLSNQSRLSLALDESIPMCKHWQKLLPHTSFVVLKPMILGNLSRIFDISNEAKKLQNNVIITTSLETAVGRMMTAVISLGIGSQNHAHGLSTANMLARNLQDDRFLSGSMIKKSQMAAYISISNGNLDSFQKYNLI